MVEISKIVNPKDLFSLFDEKLKETFQHVAYDPKADRARTVKRLKATKDKFLATEPAKGKKDFSIANNVVAWTPATPNGGTLFEAGTVYAPSERFAEAVDKTIALVEQGEFDARLEAGGEEGSAPKAPRPPRKSREGGGSTGWSEERRAKFAATMAARKAAK